MEDGHQKRSYEWPLRYIWFRRNVISRCGPISIAIPHRQSPESTNGRQRGTYPSLLLGRVRALGRLEVTRMARQAGSFGVPVYSLKTGLVSKVSGVAIPLRDLLCSV